MNFKKGLLKNGKNKNVLEIDVEKAGGIIFSKEIHLNIILLNLFTCNLDWINDISQLLKRHKT